MAPKRNTTPDNIAETDPRALFASALATGAEVISGVTPEQLDRSTPCTEFDVRTLGNHLLAAPFAVAALGRGEPYSERPEPVPFEQWRQDLDASARAAKESWADDELLGKPISLPWAELPGAKTGHGRTHAVAASFVGGRRHHAARRRGADDHRAPAQLRMIALLDGRVERVHVGM